MDFSTIDLDALIPKLEDRRVSLNLSYQNVADACNVSQSTIIRIFKRQADPSIVVLRSILAAVKYDIVTPPMPDEGSENEQIEYLKKSIEFDRGDRLMGHSSWNFLKLLNLAVEGITSFSIAPLRIATVCGVLCSISSFIYAIYFLIKTVLYGDETAGFPTLIIVMLFLGGIQLFSLGIIGEYVGRIFKETKGRPTYIASDYNEEKLGYDR